MFLIAYYQDNWILLQLDLSLAQAVEIFNDFETEYEILGIFKQRNNWAEYRPRYLIDNRDKTNWPICGLNGLINSLDSSWF